MQRILLGAIALSLVQACSYDEGLIIENLKGTVKVPKAAGTRTFIDANGVSTEVTDVKLLGPVILGLYPGISEANTVQNYPYPEVGPLYDAPNPALAYPYGGTTVGDFRFSCLQALECRLVSDRFVDFDEIIDWFNDTVGIAVVDASGQAVLDGEYLRQTCYDLLEVTSDREVRLTAEDRNDDDKIDAADLDFVLEGEYFVADFEILQQEFFWDQNQENCEPGVDCKGFSLWGFLDSPGPSYNFDSCNQGSGSGGFNVNDYATDYQGGAWYRNLLNLPSQRISAGDWVAEGYQWDDVYDQPELFIDFEVQ